MRALFLLTFLLLTALPVLGETLDLGASGRLTYEIPAGWHLKDTKQTSLAHNLELRPQPDLNAACRITVLVRPEPVQVPDEKLIANFKGGLEALLATSVEEEVKLQTLPIKGGFGVYSTLTDKSLVGKPPAPDNFKVVFPAMIKLSNTVLISVTIFTDDKDNKEVESLLKMLKEMNLDATL